MIYVCKSCNTTFANDQTDICIQCGQKNIRHADDYEIADFIGSIFLDKDEVDRICEKRKEIIDFCLSLNDTYEDYPFHDFNWTVMRHKDNKKMFAAIYEHIGNIWVNVKCDPNLTYMWRSAFESVVPAYHMNKYHWNSIILDGTVPADEIKNMIDDSYELTKSKRRR